MAQTSTTRQILARYLCLVILITGLWRPLIAQAKGGYTSGGGGGGIACFEPQKAPAIKSRYLQNGRILRVEDRRWIRSLDFTDYWEHRRTLSLSRENLLHNKRSFPFIFTLLNEAEKMLSRQEVNRAGIPLVDDLGDEDFDSKLPNECLRVQIFYRVSGHDLSANLPTVTLYADRDLISRMGVGKDTSEESLNYSIARLHEQLYVIGSEIGQLNSSHVRFISALLHSDFFNRAGLRQSGYEIEVSTRDMKDLLYLFLRSENFLTMAQLNWIPSTTSGVQTAATRRRSFASLLQKKSAVFDELLKSQGMSYLDLFKAPARYLSMRQIVPLLLTRHWKLTEEEAFLELASEVGLAVNTDTEDVFLDESYFKGRMDYNTKVMMPVCESVTEQNIRGFGDYNRRLWTEFVYASVPSSERAALKNAISDLVSLATPYCSREEKIAWGY